MRLVGGILSLGLVTLFCVGCSDSAPTATPTTNNPVVIGPQDPAPTEQPGQEIYRSVMNGLQSVPAVETSARGSVSFHMSSDSSAIIYAISVSDISDVTGASLSIGSAGQTGAAVADLFTGSRSGPFNGLLAQGRITPSMLKGSLSGRSMSELHSILSSGGAYVSVATARYPGGEIRGQVTRVATPGPV
jgi:hypothetical protein